MLHHGKVSVCLNWFWGCQYIDLSPIFQELCSLWVFHLSHVMPSLWKKFVLVCTKDEWLILIAAIINEWSFKIKCKFK